MTVIQSDVLDRLERIVDDAKARREQSVQLTQDTAETRSKAALEVVRTTFLPRIVQISNDQDDAIKLAVNNGRVAAMTEALMDGVQATPPEATALNIAQILNTVCSGSGVRMLSAPTEEGADIVATGLPVSAIDAALNTLEPTSPPPAPSEPSGPEAVEPDIDIPVTKIAAPAPSSEPTTETPADDEFGDGIAARFYQSATRVSDQRILIRHTDSTVAGPDGILSQNLDAVQQLMDDLSAWDADHDEKDAGPQLIILRAQDQDMPSLTICRDADATTMTAHHTRRLGSAVQLWKSLTSNENFS
ncbi:hypothetical protein MWU53_07315 [Aliiroseovarius sp. S1123]|jgi:hypothetical protein|uniref:hypothetical protein n=1 Tax=unclassified Aliiroseovarius TaxID=2623558 RepID=UPI001FF3EF22|nr:hypothetical protein [Aliiroseovarius sp. S1123]MCK0170862.1 hypothetical protein [Aliiroseovarius sp. S1123]